MPQCLKSCRCSILFRLDVDKVDKLVIMTQSPISQTNQLYHEGEDRTHIKPHTHKREMIIKAQWLSGRVLDSRPRGRGIELHQRHCVAVLEKDTFIIA